MTLRGEGHLLGDSADGAEALQEEGQRCGADKGVWCFQSLTNLTCPVSVLPSQSGDLLPDQILSFSCPMCKARGTWGYLRSLPWGVGGEPPLITVCEHSPKTGATGATPELPQRVRGLVEDTEPYLGKRLV